MREITKLPPELKQQWVAALRSGKYQQGRNRLRTASNNTFCCLGVFCDLLDSTGWQINSSAVPYPNYTYKLPKSAPSTDTPQPYYSLSLGDLDSYKLPDNYLYADYIMNTKVTIDGTTMKLAEHNDTGATFEQIATAIEEQL